mmetsp:Transcript_3254/g.14738  ORF Transcript_3254/g.14738 Transcript_3254/m.14738 type:complete len:340 (-) Transcript_3254:1949-2968(-)
MHQRRRRRDGRGRRRRGRRRARRGRRRRCPHRVTRAFHQQRTLTVLRIHRPSRVLFLLPSIRGNLGFILGRPLRAIRLRLGLLLALLLFLALLLDRAAHQAHARGVVLVALLLLHHALELELPLLSFLTLLLRASLRLGVGTIASFGLSLGLCRLYLAHLVSLRADLRVHLGCSSILRRGGGNGNFFRFFRFLRLGRSRRRKPLLSWLLGPTSDGVDERLLLHLPFGLVLVVVVVVVEVDPSPLFLFDFIPAGLVRRRIRRLRVHIHRSRLRLRPALLRDGRERSLRATRHLPLVRDPRDASDAPPRCRVVASRKHLAAPRPRVLERRIVPVDVKLGLR